MLLGGRYTLIENFIDNSFRDGHDVRIKTFSAHDTLLPAAGKLEQAWNGGPKIIRTIHAEPGASGC